MPKVSSSDDDAGAGRPSFSVIKMLAREARRRQTQTDYVSARELIGGLADELAECDRRIASSNRSHPSIPRVEQLNDAVQQDLAARLGNANSEWSQFMDSLEGLPRPSAPAGQALWLYNAFLNTDLPAAETLFEEPAVVKSNLVSYLDCGTVERCGLHV